MTITWKSFGWTTFEATRRTDVEYPPESRGLHNYSNCWRFS